MMQTEIQWLCSVLLECKLPKDVKDKFIARIGEVEKALSESRPQASRPIQPLIMPASTRTPPPDFDVNVPPPMPQVRNQAAEVDKSTGRVMVNNGDGTRGPRKF